MLAQRHFRDTTITPATVTAWLAQAPLPLVVSVVLALILGVALARVDWSEVVRRAAVAQLRYVLQREVTLGSVTLDLRGRILVNTLTVYDGFTRTRRLWAVRQLDIRFDPVRALVFPQQPLRAIRQVIADDPYAVITRDARGQWNFQDLLNKPKRPRSQDRFRGEVLVRNGEFIYRDAVPLAPRLPALSEHLVRVNARVTQAGGDFLPFRLSAVSQSGRLRDISLAGHLRLDEKSFQAEVNVGEVALARLRDFLPPRLPVILSAGRADARVQLAIAPGTPPLYTVLADMHDLRGTLQLPKHARPLPWTMASGQVRVTEDVAEVVGAQVVADGIAAEVDATVTRFTDPVFTAQVRTRQADTATLARYLPGLETMPFTPRGAIDGRVEIAGNRHEVQVSGHVAGPALHTPYGDFTDIATDFSFDGKSLTFSDLAARGFGGYLRGDAWVALSDNAETKTVFHGETTALSAQELIHALLPPSPESTPPPAFSLRDLHGELSGPVTLSIDRDERLTVLTRVRGRVEAPGVTHADIDTSLAIAADKTGATVTVERLDAVAPEGHFQAQGTIAADQTMNLSVRAGEVALQAIAAHADRTDLAGTASVRGQLTGTPEQLRFAGDLRAHRVDVAGRTLDDITAEVLASAGATVHVALKQLRVVADGSQVLMPTADITLAPSGGTWNVSGCLILPRTSLAALAKTAGLTDLQVDGQVEGEVIFDNIPAHPFASGRVLLRRPSLHTDGQTITLDRAAVNFTTRDNALTITDADLSYRGMPIAVTGSYAFTPPAGAPQLALRVRSTVDLDDFTALVKADDPLVGQLTDDFRVRIPLDVAGRLALDAAVTAQVTAGDEPPAQVLQRTLRIAASLDAGDSLVVVGVPYRRFATNVDLHLGTKTLTIAECTLTSRDAQYQVTLTEPAVLGLDSRNIDLHAIVRGARQANVDAPADLAAVRHDVLRMAVNASPTDPLVVKAIGLQAGPNPLLAQIAQGLDSIPVPFAGAALVKVGLSRALPHPLVTAEITTHDVSIGGNPLPDIEGSLAFDTAPRVLTIDRLVALTGTRGQTLAECSGAVTLPVKDAQGRSVVPGEMNLSFSAMDFDPALFAAWLRNTPLSQVNGRATLVASIWGDTADPRMTASLDVSRPMVNGVAFDSLSAVFTLEGDRLWIGRKGLDADGAATLQFKGADQAPIEALECYGYLPIVWKGTLQPDIAADKPLFFAVTLPRQGLDIVRSYLPQVEELARAGTTGEPRVSTASIADGELTTAGKLSAAAADTRAPLRKRSWLALPKAQSKLLAREREVKSPLTRAMAKESRAGATTVAALPHGAQPFFTIPSADPAGTPFTLYLPGTAQQAGTVEASLQIKGTRDKLEIVNGEFRAQIPEVILPTTDADLPNRLRQVAVDIGFRSEISGGREGINNVVEVNDFSAIYAREGDAQQAKKDNFRWMRRLLGIKDKRQSVFSPGAIVAQGTIRKSPRAAFDLNALDYDLYVKMVRTPVRWRDMFQGKLTSYLRLANQPVNHRPTITGVIYAEDVRATYLGAAASAGTPTPPRFPFNPALQIAIQTGPDVVFEIAQDNPLFQNSISAELPFVPTKLFTPVSQADLAYGLGVKPPVDPRHLAYRYTASTMKDLDAQEDRGTYGWITGSLEQPQISASFALMPDQSQVQLPGGSLIFEKATGTFAMKLFSPDPPTLRATANATGMVDDYTVSATVNDVDIVRQIAEGKLPLTFQTDSSPQGAPSLSHEEIRDRLLGLFDLASMMQGQDQAMLTIQKMARKTLLHGWMDKLARSAGLQTFSVDLDQMNVPEMSLITSEFGNMKLGMVRLGAKYTFSEPHTWNLWSDYRVAGYSLLRNFSLSANLNERQDFDMKLQYKFEF